MSRIVAAGCLAIGATLAACSRAPDLVDAGFTIPPDAGFTTPDAGSMRSPVCLSCPSGYSCLEGVCQGGDPTHLVIANRLTTTVTGSITVRGQPPPCEVWGGPVPTETVRFEAYGEAYETGASCATGYQVTLPAGAYDIYVHRSLVSREVQIPDFANHRLDIEANLVGVDINFLGDLRVVEHLIGPGEIQLRPGFDFGLSISTEMSGTATNVRTYVVPGKYDVLLRAGDFGGYYGLARGVQIDETTGPLSYGVHASPVTVRASINGAPLGAGVCKGRLVLRDMNYGTSGLIPFCDSKMAVVPVGHYQVGWTGVAENNLNPDPPGTLPLLPVELDVGSSTVTLTVDLPMLSVDGKVDLSSWAQLERFQRCRAGSDPRLDVNFLRQGDPLGVLSASIRCDSADGAYQIDVPPGMYDVNLSFPGASSIGAVVRRDVVVAAPVHRLDLAFEPVQVGGRVLGLHCEPLADPTSTCVVSFTDPRNGTATVIGYDQNSGNFSGLVSPGVYTLGAALSPQVTAIRIP